MSMTSTRRSRVLLSAIAIGAACWFGLAQAQAGDANVTEDQIVRALAPPKKPLTRGLTMGPQTDPAATEAEGKFVQSIRGRTTRSLSTAEREEIATIAQDKPNIDLEITFDYNSANISAKSLPSVQALPRADQRRPEGLDLHRRRPHRRRRRRQLQSGSVRAARRLDQA